MKYFKKGHDLHIICEKQEDNLTLSELWAAWHLSRKTIHLLKQDKAYTLNGTYVKEAALKNHDHLIIRAYQHDDGMYPPEYRELDIIYEDDLLLVVNKPPHLPVYPSDRDLTHSLSHQVSAYYQMQGLDLPVRFIHRLDDDTSGLIIYVKCALLQAYMDFMIKEKQIRRHYLAFVSGHFESHEIHTIKTYLAKDRHQSRKMRIASSGVEAITQYRCLQNYDGYALVGCELKTGRRHQIRVHMASIGHPLLGDALYNKHPGPLSHQALHADQLTFKHPITREQLTLTAPLPLDLAALKKEA
ncbi:MAG: RluA family pseudouridine synthase [bacterium]